MIMKTKRLLSVLLCVMLLMGLVPVAGLTTHAQESTVYYANDTTSLNTILQSISAGSAGATIIVQTDQELSVAVPHTVNGITITSEATASADKPYVYLSAQIQVKGDLTLGSVKLTIKEAGQYSGFVLKSVKLTSTTDFESGWLDTSRGAAASTGKGPEVCLSVDTSKTEKRNILNLAGGHFYVMYLGTHMSGRDYSFYGADITLSNNVKVQDVTLHSSRSMTTAYNMWCIGDIVIRAYDTAAVKNMNTFGVCQNKTNASAKTRHIGFSDGKSLRVIDYTASGLVTTNKLINLPAETASSVYYCDDAVCNYEEHIYYVRATSCQENCSIEPLADEGVFTTGAKTLIKLSEDATTKAITVQKGTFVAENRCVTSVSLVNTDVVSQGGLCDWYTSDQYTDANKVNFDTLSDGEYILYPDLDLAAFEFVSAGTQIRERDTALRCIVRLGHKKYKQILANAKPDTITLGVVIINAAMLNGRPLVKYDKTSATTYSYKNATYAARYVEATNFMVPYTEDMTGSILYNVTLTNFDPMDYKLSYAYRGVVEYTDKNGVLQTEYSEPATLGTDPTDVITSQADGTAIASLWKTAQGIIGGTSVLASADTASAQHIIENAAVAGEPDYLYTQRTDINPAETYMKKTSALTVGNERAAIIRNTVRTYADTLEAQTIANGKRNYYVADVAVSGDGTKASPWTLAQLLSSYSTIPSGASVLFRRGDVFRNVSFGTDGLYTTGEKIPAGVNIGAYDATDDGQLDPKPILIGCDQNYANVEWEKVAGHDNVYRVALSDEFVKYSGDAHRDVGAIVFDHGRMVASAGKKRTLYTGATNEANLPTEANIQARIQLLTNNYDFFATPTHVYLYLRTGNPAEQHVGIELLPKRQVVNLRTSNHIVENLCVKYTGRHGISTASVNDVEVRGCEVGYIGGAETNMQGERLGNGIEFFGKTDNCHAHDNWIYECFDTGYTNQSTSVAASGSNPAPDVSQSNITARNNLIEYCLYNIEIWVNSATGYTMSNVTLSENVLRFAGYGFGTLGRKLPPDNKGNEAVWSSNIAMASCITLCQNVTITNNVLDYTYRYIVDAECGDGATKPIFTGNYWAQNATGRSIIDGDRDATVAGVAIDDNNHVPNRYYCATQADMITNVALYDTAPAQIWYNNKQIQ